MAAAIAEAGHDNTTLPGAGSVLDAETLGELLGIGPIMPADITDQAKRLVWSGRDLTARLPG